MLDLTGHGYRRVVLTVDDPEAFASEPARAPAGARLADLDRTQPSSTRTGNVSTGSYAGSVSGRPVVMSKREPWRGQTATHSSSSHTPSQSGPSSCEQRSSSA